MSPAPSPSPHDAPGEIRTYRGRTLEELIPRIRAELGAGAIILRERQGLTGGIAGFFAQRCVEIEAQAAPRVSVYADDDDDLEEIDEELEVDEQTFLAAASPSTPAPEPFSDTPPAAPAAPFAPVPSAPAPLSEPAAIVPPAPEPSAAPVSAPAPISASVPAPVSVPEPAPVAEPAAPPAPAYIAFDELSAPTVDTPTGARTDAEPAPSAGVPGPAPIAVPIHVETVVPEPAPVITTEGVFRAASSAPVATTQTSAPIADPVPAAPAPAPVVAPAPTPVVEAAPEPVAEQAPVAPTPATDDRAAEQALIRHLSDQGFGPDFATALVADAARLAGPGADPVHAVQARLAASLPQPATLPVTGGAIAIVGSGGSGKTRAAAALATAYARAGHTVTVARLGTPERSNELAELLRDETVQVIPAMRTRATTAAVTSARERGLVIVDTTSVSMGDRSATEILAETLAPFALDAVLLAAPATFTARTTDRLVQSFNAVRPDGLIATHVDEADGLGAVAEVAIGRRIPLGFVHSGLELASAISAVEPGQLAGALVR